MSGRKAGPMPAGAAAGLPVMVDICVEGGDWPEADMLQALADEAVAAAMAVVAPGDGWRRGGELSVLFCDDARARALNRQWRGRDAATNVLSFPQQGPGRRGGLIGDIALAQETVYREAALDGKQVTHHIAHLIVHGFLHLLGYDHENDQDAEIMEGLERRALMLMAIADPHALDHG